MAWAALLLLTVAVTGPLVRLRLPAALVLGPMLAAIAVAQQRPGLRLPGGLVLAAQAVLGCLIASALSPALLVALLPSWPVLVGMNLLSMASILALGLLAARRRWLPGTAAIWGMSPGGASTMVLLAQAHGADARLVALMQYLRLLAAALAVIVVGTLFGRPAAQPVLALPGAGRVPWLSPVSPVALLATGALALTGIGLSIAWRRSTLALMVPVFAGMGLQAGRWTGPEVPPLAAALAFAVVGWHIGLGFTRPALAESARLLPRVLLCVALVLGVCTLLAALLAWCTPIDFITAYMALNPGGMDSVLLVAASLQVDLPMILAMQVARVLLVIGVAPVLGRVAARHHAASSGPS